MYYFMYGDFCEQVTNNSILHGICDAVKHVGGVSQGPLDTTPTDSQFSGYKFYPEWDSATLIIQNFPSVAHPITHIVGSYLSSIYLFHRLNY